MKNFLKLDFTSKSYFLIFFLEKLKQKILDMIHIHFNTLKLLNVVIMVDLNRRYPKTFTCVMKM